MSAPIDESDLPRLLNEKLQQLIQRERDVHTLMRSVAVASRWYESAAKLCAAVAALDDRRQATVVLAEAFSESLGHEYAAVRWGAIEVFSPRLVPPAIAAAFGKAFTATGRDPLTQCRADDGEVRETIRLEIPSKLAPGEVVLIVTARTERTSGYGAALDRAARERLTNLSEMLTGAFDAVRLRERLVKERDSLQLAIDEATGDLREAISVAEHARADAERAAGARSEFLANMSHEIRTPMTAILGYAELMLDGQVSPETQRRYLDIIVRSGRHLLQILDDVLDLARIESGRVELHVQALELPALLLELQSLLAVRAVERKLVLNLHLVAPVPDLVMLDGYRLRQILINLVGNALKFTERGSVTIEAGMFGDELRVAVIDTGVGIPPEKCDAIFESFEQVHQGATRRHSGTGLGLAISRRLARLMGGDISVASQLGVGSRFELRAPCPLAPEARMVSALHVSEAAPTAQVDEQRLAGSVLIVDDTAANRGVLTAMLGRYGLHVEAAEDGAAALAAVRTAAAAGRPYDVVFMDMQMPVMDGYQATRLLKAELANLPVVALTANAMAGDRDACLAAGCVDYLSKPIRRGELYAVLVRYVGNADAVVSEYAADDVIRDLLPDFYTDLRRIAGALESAAGESRRVDIGRLGHEAKGMSATFGFPVLAKAMGALEHGARDQAVAWSAVERLVDAAVREARRVLPR